jgi:threonine/homoserine/homoserine lactone efflux protein
LEEPPLLTYLVQGITLGFSAVAFPGPLQAFLLNQTLANGWRKTLPAALAPLISDGPIILVMVFVLSQTPAWFLQLIQILGGIFLLYLAYGAWKGYRGFTPDGPQRKAGEKLNMLKAALINASGPGPYIFWSLIAGPIFLKGLQENLVFGISFLIGFYLVLLSGFAGFIILFATAKRLGSKITHALLGLSAFALLAFGLFQIIDGLKQVMSL